MQAVDDALDEELVAELARAARPGLAWTSTHPLVSLEEVPPLGVDGGDGVVTWTLHDGHGWWDDESEV